MTGISFELSILYFKLPSSLDNSQRIIDIIHSDRIGYQIGGQFPHVTRNVRHVFLSFSYSFSSLKWEFLISIRSTSFCLQSVSSFGSSWTMSCYTIIILLPITRIWWLSIKIKWQRGSPVLPELSSLFSNSIKAVIWIS